MPLNLKKAKYPFFKQFDAMTSGPNCLKMISRFYGKDVPVDDARTWCSIGKYGVCFACLSDTF
ncbi:MAG: cysteine peptidase family C39 domain-containing protein [Flavobacteriaceae bacterium]